MLVKVLEMIIFIMLLVAVWRMSRGKEQTKFIYDERQKEIIANGHKYGFYTAIIGNVVGFVILDKFTNMPVAADFIMCCVIFTALAVDVLYSIAKGAYYGIRNNWKYNSLLMIILGVFLEVGNISLFLKDGLIDGRLNWEYIGFPSGIFVLLAGIASVIKGLRSSKEDAE